MRYGLVHMLILDADSKFKGQFKEACGIFKLKSHTVSKGHRDVMLVERFNRYLNGAIKLFASDRNSTRVFIEGSQMAIYAWISAPVIGTNLSCSLVAVGREFHFPIDFENRRHISFSSNKNKICTYTEDLLYTLEKCQYVYQLLISQQREYHREYRNSQLNDPKKCKVKNIDFARFQVQSSLKTRRVKKLTYQLQGLYKVTKLYPSGSYELLLQSSTSKRKGESMALIYIYIYISPTIGAI